METPLVASIGECMLELSILPDGGSSFAWGGDTLNTAVYLAREGIAVDYVTALGDDPFSDAMLAGWRAEGVGTERVQRCPGRLPGLYAIRRDAKGERSFYYWRDRAPARELFAGEMAATTREALHGYGWIYLSGISLSLWGEAGRAALFEVLDEVRASGAKVAFDTNFRPRGWPDRDEARSAYAAMLRRTDLALPTHDDEAALFGDADVEATIRRIAAHGVEEIVVKQGRQGCTLMADGVVLHVPASAAVDVVDTTAAGDSFNAGYIAERLRGREPAAAARRGHLLAAVVIGHVGAIVPREAMPARTAETLG